MENEDANRERKVTTRFRPGEFSVIDNRFKKSRFRKMSEYIRCVLLEKPVTVNYRDKSMDEMLEELSLLRRIKQGDLDDIKIITTPRYTPQTLAAN